MNVNCEFQMNNKNLFIICICIWYSLYDGTSAIREISAAFVHYKKHKVYIRRKYRVSQQIITIIWMNQWENE